MKAYDNEMLAFTFGDWINLQWVERDARQAEIDARHGYKHGWIIADGACIRSAIPHSLTVYLQTIWD